MYALSLVISGVNSVLAAVAVVVLRVAAVKRWKAE